MSIFRRLGRETHAATAAEFALVLPLLIVVLFGIIDAGRYMWEFNEAEKATQMGVRYAVVTDPVSDGLYGYSFAVSDGVPQGSAVPTSNFDNTTCNDTTCSCTGGAVCSSITWDQTAFDDIWTRMNAFYPAIQKSNISIEYKNVGLGFAGDPDGSDVSPLVTVKLSGLEFRPITCLVFACSIAMPDFRASLTGEDLSGDTSN